MLAQHFHPCENILTLENLQLFKNSQKDEYSTFYVYRQIKGKCNAFCIAITFDIQTLIPLQFSSDLKISETRKFILCFLLSIFYHPAAVECSWRKTFLPKGNSIYKNILTKCAPYLLHNANRVLTFSENIEESINVNPLIKLQAQILNTYISSEKSDLSKIQIFQSSLFLTIVYAV